MKYNDTIQQFFEGIDPSNISPDPGDMHVETFDYCTRTSAEAMCVVDFFERQFRYVSVHDLFLCGYSREQVMKLGYDFYPEIVHPDDLQLLIKMHRVILNSPYILEKEMQENIYFFYFTVKIKNYPCLYQQNYLMTCCKIRPVFIDNKIRYGVCAFSISAMLSPGNLRVYFNDNKEYQEYSFIYNMWLKAVQSELFSDREIEILKLSTQGLSKAKIANELCISTNTLEHAITALLSKLPEHIKTIKDAVIYASNLLQLHEHKKNNDDV
jgi:DNA-binding CsgD family transcriptional regulator